MPFCTQCGTQVSEADAFCANCGKPQRSTGRPFRPAADPLSGMSPRVASILCYVPTMGWIASVVVLTSRKFKHDGIVRFHAFQGLYLFALWLLVQWVIHPLFWNTGRFFRAEHLLDLLLLGLSVFMMIKASQDDPYVLPIIGELAQRSAAGQ